ncbi:GntR family transcriptional regulator [Cryptosporangium sp. NPDC051539]|uniref:GntR family transcriptional regulator n=1 Tax=Cryptosporangium sp. NPDC051539 TaxID=3363962 RepID=UPI00378D0F1E
MDHRTTARDRDPDDGSDGSIVARLTAQLREEILSGALKPGERIRQEEIGRRAGVSRAPAREALRALSGEGLVTLAPNVGARVARLEPAELDEVYLIREHLEPAALAHSIPHLTVSQLAALAGMHAQMGEIAGSDEPMAVGRFLEIDRDFHLLMTSAGPMKRLHAIVKGMIDAAQPYRRALLVSDPLQVLRTTNEEHGLILDAVRNGEVQDAATLLELHIRRTRHALERASEMSGLGTKLNRSGGGTS